MSTLKHAILSSVIILCYISFIISAVSKHHLHYIMCEKLI